MIQSNLFQNHTQVIYGNIPAKSNSYIPIILRRKGSQKSHVSIAKSKRLKKYEKDFIAQCNKYRNANIAGYFCIDIKVYYPTMRSDLDNATKVLLDCLQQVKAFKNDNRCVKIIMEKFIDKKSPRVEFTITRR